MTASATAAAPVPSKASRQLRVKPTARTIVSASTNSTPEARAADTATNIALGLMVCCTPPSRHTLVPLQMYGMRAGPRPALVAPCRRPAAIAGAPRTLPQHQLLNPVVASIADIDVPTRIGADPFRLLKLPRRLSLPAVGGDEPAPQIELLDAVVAAVGHPQMAAAVERQRSRRVEASRGGSAPTEDEEQLPSRRVLLDVVVTDVGDPQVAATVKGHALRIQPAGTGPVAVEPPASDRPAAVPHRRQHQNLAGGQPVDLTAAGDGYRVEPHAARPGQEPPVGRQLVERGLGRRRHVDVATRIRGDGRGVVGAEPAEDRALRANAHDLAQDPVGHVHVAARRHGKCIDLTKRGASPR